MIEVFKTDVQHSTEAGRLLSLLQAHFPASRINFDLDDCDRILRLEGNDFDPDKVVSLVKTNGFHCVVLD